MNPLLQSVQLALQNATQKEALAFIDRVVDFCIEMENGKVLDGWPRHLIKLLVAYHMAKDTIIIKQGKEGKILGVLMWYHCNEDDDWFFVKNWRSDRSNGDAIFMAFLFAMDNLTFKQITHDFIVKCPDVMHKKLLGIRYRNSAPTRVVYSTKLFKKILGV